VKTVIRVLLLGSRNLLLHEFLNAWWQRSGRVVVLDRDALVVHDAEVDVGRGGLRLAAGLAAAAVRLVGVRW
jgi:hypothetical protein